MTINNFAKTTFGPAVMLLTLATGITTTVTNAHAQSPWVQWSHSQVEETDRMVENALNGVERMYGIRSTPGMSNDDRVLNLLKQRMNQMTPEELIATGNKAAGMTRIDKAQQQIRDDVKRSNAEIQRQNYVGQARSNRDYYENLAQHYAAIGDGWNMQAAANAANAWGAEVRQYNNGRD